MIHYKFNLKIIVINENERANWLVLDLLFGSAVIHSAELNTETEDFETLESVMQFMVWECEEVKGKCELFGDDLYENRKISQAKQALRVINMRLK